MKIGVFGGTFDPIHLGHLIVADEAREMLELDEVLFIPAGRPYDRYLVIISRWRMGSLQAHLPQHGVEQRAQSFMCSR